jgi:hypothetical protein
MSLIRPPRFLHLQRSRHSSAGKRKVTTSSGTNLSGAAFGVQKPSADLGSKTYFHAVFS